MNLDRPRHVTALFANTRSHLGALLIVVVSLLVAVAAGASMPRYVDALEGSALKLAAAPAALVLAILLIHSRLTLLFLVVLVRASCDVALETSRFGFGGAEIGIGGLINGFVILIAALLVMERPGRWSPRLFGIWLPFLLVALAGVFLTPDRGSAIRLYLQQLSTFAIFVGGWYAVDSLADLRKCIKLIVASSAVPVAIGLFELATGTGTMSDDAGIRVRATFGHANILAFYLVLVISLVLYLLRSPAFAKSAGKRFALSLYMIVLLIVLGSTKTRSAWISCVVLFALYGFIFERRFLAYLTIGAVMAFFIPGINDRVLEVLGSRPAAISSLTPLNSFEWRESLWTSALGWMTPSRYFVGYGFESFPYYSTTFFGGTVHFGAHNDYVQILFELGAVGLLAFVHLYTSTLVQLRTMLKLDRLVGFLMMALIVEYLVVCASDNMMQYLSFNWYVWFLLGAGLAASARAAAKGSSAEHASTAALAEGSSA